MEMTQFLLKGTKVSVGVRLSQQTGYSFELSTTETEKPSEQANQRKFSYFFPGKQYYRKRKDVMHKKS